MNWRKLRYALEAALLVPFFVLLRLLPLDVASAFGGWLARMLGPFARAHATARTNLERVLPEYSEQQRNRILRDMWDNLGRVIGEYPHLSRPIMAKRITVEGIEYLEKVKASGKGVVFVSGHFANWEIMPLTAALHDFPLILIYRAANNPVADWLIRTIRSHYNKSMYNKGRVAAAQSLKALREGDAIGMLIDQKMNDGMNVPFFGLPAMTVTAPIQLAAKFNVPIIATQIVRTDGAHFHITLEPPMVVDTNTDQVAAMATINALFEGWIRENPGQWFWVHRRWTWGK